MHPMRLCLQAAKVPILVAINKVSRQPFSQSHLVINKIPSKPFV